jgi:hypothetical protein
MDQILSKIKNFIVSNQVEMAIEALLEISHSSSDIQNNLLSQLAKYRDIKRKENMGVLRQDDLFVLHAQVINVLLEIFNEIQETEVDLKFANRTRVPLNQESEGSKFKVFVSYNHQDLDYATKLIDRLKIEDIDVTIDNVNMIAGGDIKDFIENGIKNSNAVISIVSNNSLLSAWVAMESINTFHQNALNPNTKFIACYISNDFFKRDFTDSALDIIEAEIEEIQDLITSRMLKNRSIRDLQNELDRMTSLRNNIDEIVRRLREYLCIDIRNENFENNFIKIINAIKS